MYHRLATFQVALFTLSARHVSQATAPEILYFPLIAKVFALSSAVEKRALKVVGCRLDSRP
jgi:hypothetical protein